MRRGLPCSKKSHEGRETAIALNRSAVGSPRHLHREEAIRLEGLFHLSVSLSYVAKSGRVAKSRGVAAATRACCGRYFFARPVAPGTRLTGPVCCRLAVPFTSLESQLP
jgi:hypothetical protein